MSTSTSNNILIPWPCFISSSDPPFPTTYNNKTNHNLVPITKIEKKKKKTFAQALSNVCDVPLSQFPQPCMKGDRVAIEIP